MNDDERYELAQNTILFFTDKCENITESVQVLALINWMWNTASMRGALDNDLKNLILKKQGEKP